MKTSDRVSSIAARYTNLTGEKLLASYTEERAPIVGWVERAVKFVRTLPKK